MIRLVRSEIAKVWKNRVFITLLGVLLFANLFLLWLVTNPSRTAYSAHAYQTMNAQLSGMTMPEKYTFINEEFEKIKALNIIDNILRTEAYNNGIPDKDNRQRYANEFEQYFALYQSKNFLVYNDTITKEYYFLQRIQAECESVYHYDAFLETMAQNAKQLAAISIFAETADGYDIKNIQATAAAYAQMKDVSIDYVPQMGIFTALDFSLTDLILVFAMLLIATVLVRTERDNGMLVVIRATPAGRMKTAGTKCITLIVSLGCVLILLYGVNFLYCHFVYGLGDMQRSIQSVPALMRSTLKLSLGQYIALFMLTKWLAAMVAGTWVMFAMLLARRAFTGTLGALFLLGVNLLVRTLIPATSQFNIIKYANLISLLRTNELIGGYRNLYWFATPVSIVIVESVTSIVCLLLFLFLFCHTFAHAQLRSAQRFSLPVILRKNNATTVQKQECHKLFIMNGALAFVILFAGYQVHSAFTTQTYLDADEIYYRYYAKLVEGPADTEAIAALRQAQEEFAPIIKLQNALQQHLITQDEYQVMMNSYNHLIQKQNAFYRVVNKLEYFKTHPRAQFVYETGYLQLFDLNDKEDCKDSLLAALLCALCFSGLFSMEKQSGMEKVITATPLGRTYTVTCKLRATTLVCVILTLLSVLPRIWIILRDYGLGAFAAPLYSISEYSAMIELPLFFILFLFVFARYLSLRAIASVTLCFSDAFKNGFSALFASGICFVLPILLSIVGLPGTKWVSIYPAFHIAALFISPSTAFIALLSIAFYSILIYGSKFYLTEHFGTAV